MTIDRRRFIVTTGAALAAPLLPQSFGTAQAATPVRGGNLVVGLQGGAATDSLDPTLAASGPAGNLIKQVGDHLIMPTPDGRGLEAMLAESWEHSDDLLKWNFKLRKGVTFHNGKSFTAKDAVFSLNRHRGENTKSGAAGSMKTVADIKAENDHELTITLSAANIDFPYILTDYHLTIQPDGDSGDSGMGTGPYQISEVNHGVRYVTSKYKDYWRSDVGFVDTVEILVINDGTARVTALLNGQAHLVDRVEPKVLHLIKGFQGAKIIPTAGRSHYSFAMRCDQPPFDNADLRMALKLAIDRELMVKQILQGYGTPGNDSPINDSYPLAAKLEQRVYDPQKAAEYYKKSGHSGPITLQVSDVAFSGAVDAAALFKEQAAAAGITIDVRREPGDGYWSEVWNKAPFCATYWDGRPTQDQALSLAYKSDAPWNDTAWHRPEFDKLLVDARVEADEARRTEMYKKACEMVRDDGGAIIPVFTQWLDGVSNKVQGFVPDINNELMNARYPEYCWLSE